MYEILGGYDQSPWYMQVPAIRTNDIGKFLFICIAYICVYLFFFFFLKGSLQDHSPSLTANYMSG